MFERARHGFHDQPGPLSPNVFWVRNHRWIQVTSVDGDGAHVRVSADLAGAFEPLD